MAASSEGGAGEAKAAAAVAAASGGGGMQAWLPLIVTLIAMPAVAFAATKFLIVPQVQQALRGGGAEAGGGHAATAEGGHGGAGGESKHGASTKEKQTLSFSKVIVNVAGTMGTRYLMSSFTLVGAAADFRSRAEERKDELIDLASTALGSKTIAELEKPGARNQVRAELIALFNTALGEGAVKDLHITEFAIQ